MRCPRKGCDHEAQINPVFGVLPCQACQLADHGIRHTKSPEFYSLRQAHRVQAQRDRHAKDILQPFLGNKVNPDFFKAYPDQIKNYGVEKELAKL